MPRIEEYDDGYDSAASFEAAGADRPEDCEDPADRLPIWRVVIQETITTEYLIEAPTASEAKDVARQYNIEGVRHCVSRDAVNREVTVLPQCLRKPL